MKSKPAIQTMPTEPTLSSRGPPAHRRRRETGSNWWWSSATGSAPSKPPGCCLARPAAPQPLPLRGSCGPSNCHRSRPRSRRLPSAVAMPDCCCAPDTLEILPPTCWRIWADPILQRRNRASGGCRLRELCWNHTTLHARAHDPGDLPVRCCWPQTGKHPSSRP